MKKTLFIIGGTLVGLILLTSVAFGATFQGYQGGTGYSTTSASNVGSALTVASTSPFLTYGFTAISSNYWTLSTNFLYPTSTAYSVGIGTTTPAYKLDVVGDIRTTTNITLGTINGILKAASGLVGTATSGIDYAPATIGTNILKGNGSGGFNQATSSVDYAPATSGSSILKGNGSGGFSSAVNGTDYSLIATTTCSAGSYIVSVSSTGAFTCGIDYNAFQWSASYTSSTTEWNDNIVAVTPRALTIDTVSVSARDSGNTLSWNLYYVTDPTAATSTWNPVFSAFKTATSTPGGAFSYTPDASSTPAIGQSLIFIVRSASSSLTNWTIKWH